MGSLAFESGWRTLEDWARTGFRPTTAGTLLEGLAEIKPRMEALIDETIEARVEQSIGNHRDKARRAELKRVIKLVHRERRAYKAAGKSVEAEALDLLLHVILSER